MTAKRTERLLNLLLALLAAPAPVSREQVRVTVAGYGDCPSDDAFERMFERDKEELRSMGIPVQTVSTTTGEVVGYRVRREDYALPDICLTPAERSVLGLAAQVWQEAALGQAAVTAVRKLETHTSAPIVPGDVGVAPSVAAPDPALLPMWQAVRERREVRFEYRRPDQAHPVRRRLHPWGVVSWRGRWYAVGHDRDRDDTRVFRLSRVSGPVTPVGRPGAFEVPADADLPALVRARTPDPGGPPVTLRLAPGRAMSLRRLGRPREDDPDVVVIRDLDGPRLVAEIAAAGQDAVVLDPPDVAAAVRDHLAAVLVAHGGTA